MAPSYPSNFELMNKCESAEETPELTLEELRRTTWDYSAEGAIGLYNEKPILLYMFEVKECGDVNPFVVAKCNVAEGWVEHIEVEGDPLRNKDGSVFFPGKPKRDVNDDVVRTKVNCKVVVDVIDRKGNVIVTLS